MEYRRRCVIPMLLLLVVLGLGIAYAATTGVLNFSGTALINPNAMVAFEDYYIDIGKATDRCYVSDNNQTLNFTVRLDRPGDLAVIRARVINDGNVPVVLGNLTMTTNPPSGITVTWPAEFNGLRLEVGDVSPYSDIIVEWIGNYDIAPDSYSFSATLSYMQTT